MISEYLSDEEILFYKWISDSSNALTPEQIKTQESIIKYCFLQGFSCGFSYKSRLRAEESLQK